MWQKLKWIRFLCCDSHDKFSASRSASIISYLHFDGTASDGSYSLTHKINIHLCGVFLEFSQHLQERQKTAVKYTVCVPNTTPHTLIFNSWFSYKFIDFSSSLIHLTKLQVFAQPSNNNRQQDLNNKNLLIHLLHLNGVYAVVYIQEKAYCMHTCKLNPLTKDPNS